MFVAESKSEISKFQMLKYVSFSIDINAVNFYSIFKILEFIKSAYTIYQIKFFEKNSMMYMMTINVDEIKNLKMYKYNIWNVLKSTSKYTIIKSKMFKHQIEIYENR